MKVRTIIDAVTEVLAASKVPRTADEIYQEIVDKKLYEFMAKDPKAVMRASVRKAIKSAPAREAVLLQTDDGRFTLARR